MTAITTWYVPSFWGDIRLRPDGDTGCMMTIDKVTALEEQALRKLHGQGVKKGWIGDIIPVDDMVKDGMHRIAAPIATVAKALAKHMKAGRHVIHAVKFADGKMYEDVEAETADLDADAKAARERARDLDGPYRTPGDPRVAASVAAPVRGCPAPAFDKAEIKAREVLTAFLNTEQIVDFQDHNRFVSTGASGRRYMVTSRRATDSLALYTRSLYDLDDNQPLCVHDWSVPAAEEMLTLHLLLQLPRWENYLRHLET